MRKALDNRFENLDIPELEVLLEKALAKEVKDYMLIHRILEVLKSKIKPLPEASKEEVDEAMMLWETVKPAPIVPKSFCSCKKLFAIATAVLCLFVIIFPVASAASFVQEIIAKWNDKFFWIEAPGATATTSDDYVFQTDNPGLQQLYEAVTELGITQPVVPMWLPDNFEIIYLKTSIINNNEKILACFSDGNLELVYSIDKINTAMESHKNSTVPESWNIMGTRYFYIQNSRNVKITWTYGSYEIMITGPISKSVMYTIIESIY